MAAELGQFASGIASLRRLLVSVAEPDRRFKVFENACAEVASYVARGLERTTAADLLYDMAQAGDLAGDEDEIQTVISDAFSNIENVRSEQDEQKTNGRHYEPLPTITPTVYTLPDPATIPQRAWLYGWHYVRSAVTATVAPGGFGKTTLALFEAMTMVKDKLRVWYISGEDDRTELDRRIAAHCQEHAMGELDGRLFVDDKLSFPFKIAKSNRGGPEFDEPKLVAFEKAILSRRIDVVMLDPFVSFHVLSENDTAAMDALIKRLGDICVRAQCCIELSHHVRKPGMGQVEVTVYDARGAAAIVNAVRSCRVLNQMSSIEAQQMKFAENQRGTYIRVDSGKRNMAPPEKARWWQLVSVPLANGDFVQAIRDFEFKPEQSVVADEDWLVLLLKNAEKPYRADSRSSDWLGHAVAKHFNRGSQTKGDVIWINKQIKKWLDPRPPDRDALICKVERLDDTRQSRLFFQLVSK